MHQLAYIKTYEYAGGKMSGVRALDVSNGTGLEFTLLESKCLDIINMKYKGMNLNYFPKSGIVSPYLADMNGTEFMRSISGGMMYTCGLFNVATPCVDDGFTQVFHGRMKNTPAEKVNASCEWEGDDYVLKVSGEMREAAIFNDNLLLKRTVVTRSGSKFLRVSDEIENQGFEEQGIMLLYHINVGFPVLDDDARLLLPSVDVVARDDISKAGLGENATLTGPVDGFTEHVFKHKMACDGSGITGSAVINDRLGLGVYIKYDTRQLPYLVEWKSMMSGDYAIGIMPSTCFVNGRVYEKEHGTLRMVPPFGKERFDIEIGVLDGEKEIKEFAGFVGSLL